ncbi:MAG: helix-turn-helix transcriptional regulator [Pseudobutyrivibrio sp.]|nr:helix-turn-helix transcriptional regulator [Pseudobutyrivibrio sp.]
MTDIMKFIKTERKRRGIPQSAVAFAAMVDPATMCLYEKYTHEPKFVTVESMLDFLGYEIVIRKKGTQDE